MKVGRNDPCPCGSGKKHKKCCLGKVSDVQLKYLYLQQLELTQALKDEEKCLKVLEIGERIILANQESECITGTYVNMALAKRILYRLSHKNNELYEAKKYCKLAINLKHNNQVALRTLFGVCLDLEEYQSAYNAFELYEITDMFNPMTVQIIEEYQNAIMATNSDTFLEENKIWIDKITDLLFHKFGYNAGICGVAVMYYLGVGNDALKAYELGKRCIEEWPNSATFNSIGWVCLNDEINRKDDAVTYFLKAIEYEDDENQKLLLHGNYFIALMESGRYEEAENLMLDLINRNPCNQNFSNYAELLKRLGRYEEALTWGIKALYLVEDDTTLLVVADICKKSSNFDKAIQMYQLCLGHLNAKENIYKFSDHNQNILYSMSTNNSMDLTLYEVLGGLISVHFTKRDFESAKIYLDMAREKLPMKNDWEIWNQSLSEVDVNIQRQNEIKKQLSEIEQNVELQKNYIRQWADKLLKLQNNSEHINLDENDDWECYKNEMDSILCDMEKLINRDSSTYINACSFINSNFPRLNEKSKEFLITAETLYEIHKMSIIDFAPIVVEYSKVVEKQLRVLLDGKISDENKTLGSVLYIINTRKIQPYKQYLRDLYKVNKLRKSAAHTGVLTRTDVEEIRRIFFENNLIHLLT